MNNIKIVENCITIIGILVDIYIISKIVLKKRKILKGNKCTENKNNIYIVLIMVNMILFLICGIIRNFG
ncbi:MAG: hypothetical protein J6K42_00200 [Clostridia bacterium]|nr:hypothetical protein [Clostridia bacterium]